MDQGQRDALKIAMGIGFAVLMVLIGVLWVMPDVANGIAGAFAPGLGIKMAAKYAFLLSSLMVLAFALLGGDGVVGELGVMLIGFLLLFVVNTLLLAWLF